MREAAGIARLVIVEGLVQGVGYREFTRRAALRRAITGWVRNRSNGAVEALLVGAEGDIETLLAELRRGPRGASVTAVRVADGAADARGAGETFVILPTL